MKYILMCGGKYPKWDIPKQLQKINNEVIVERTIRLLRENGITDIAVSTNDERFNYLDVELLHNKDDEFETLSEKEVQASKFSWLNAYYPVDEEVCYLHGDVYFSDEAIKTIVDTKVKDTMFFCVPDVYDIPNKDKRNIKGREPLAYKVVNYKLFRNAINDLMRMIDEGKFKNAKQSPIAWTVYRYLNGLDIGLNAKDYGDLNNIFNTKGDYIVINDYTTDIDSIKDIKKIEDFIKGGNKMIKVEVIKEFNFGDFYKIKDTLIRKSRAKEGYLYVGDTFICNEPMMKYLTGSNDKKLVVVKVIEVIPEETKEEVVEDIVKEDVNTTKKPRKKKK